jgi:hypothetical protein
MNDEKGCFQNFRLLDRANVELASEGGPGVPMHLKFIYPRVSLGNERTKLSRGIHLLFLHTYHGERTRNCQALHYITDILFCEFFDVDNY